MMNNGLSVCIITKNNEKTIGRCISSVIGIAGEIIVVDSGSNDKTKSICSSLGAKIYDFQWKDNFSDAKNFAISKANGQWVLNLDADETISEKDTKKIKEIVDKNEDYDGYYLIQRNYSNQLGSFGWVSSRDDEYEESKIAKGFTPRKMLRLFRNKQGIKFEGVVHDSVIKSIENIHGKINETNIVIHHYGYVERGVEGGIERTEKYVEIEKQNLRGDYFQEYQIASQLHSIGKLNEAVEHLAKSIELNPGFYLSLLELAIISIKKGKVSEAKPLLIKSLQLKEHEMAWEHLGIVEVHEKNFDKAIACFNKAIEMNPKNADFYFNLGNTLKLAGRANQAKQAYAKAVYLNPDYSERIE